MMTAWILTAFLAFAKDHDIEIKDIPPAVRAAILRKYPSATLLEAEQDEKGYEVKFNVGSAKQKIYVSPDGTIRKEKLEN